MKINTLLVTAACAIKCAVSAPTDEITKGWECYCFHLDRSTNPQFDDRIILANQDTYSICQQNDVRPAEFHHYYWQRESVCRPFTDKGALAFQNRCREGGARSKCYKNLYVINKANVYQ
ncbi:hypothetical protein LZ30DRAFT_723390 [Colletotrichum cereale]|nr:hypothetical protein LZ30DRAFT_723390 [Colletotrichum cereale]